MLGFSVFYGLVSLGIFGKVLPNKRKSNMKYELNLLIEKGLVSDSLQLCKSIYFSNKGTSPSKEYNTVLKIHKLARRLESL